MTPNDFTIRPERPTDYRTVENLTREAFWNVYHPGCTEHYVLHRYRSREDFVPELDLVMEKDGEIIGHIMYAHAEIAADDGRAIPVMTFGPISIAPAFQRRGYGKALLDASMERAKALGASVLCIEGNILFYGKSGFVPGFTRGIDHHAAPRGSEVPYFLLKELKAGFLNGVTGVFHTPDGYFTDAAEVDAFDAQFPVKQKLRLPGQLA